MWQSIENTIKYIEDGVLEHLTKMRYLHSNRPHRPRMENSISASDAHFLQLACLVEKPKKIMEIGTWIGTSAYALSQASDALIYTCDEGPDNFYIFEGQESYTDRIIRHPDTHSSEFFKKIDGGFDFVFVDGWLKDDDAKDIFEKCEDNFTFITHDYYRPEKPKPVFCKGHHAVERMIKYAWENDYDCELCLPSPDWCINNDFIGGYHIKKFGIINKCCAMIKFSRI
jgi:hypothetical protein